jgi:hypothetical protein
MAKADNGFLQSFYQQLIDRPLEPGNPFYVPLYARDATSPSDPVNELQATIEWSPIDSAQLFSGFRGTGKSTELRRLKAQLEQGNTVVVLCDMQQYLNLTTPIDVSDFLLAVAGAFGDELAKDPTLLGQDIITEGYWTRFVAFLTRTRIEVSSLGLSAGLDASAGLDQTKLGAKFATDIKLNLKEDPTFRQKLQDRLKGHLGALVRDVHRFFGECILALRNKHRDPELRVVMLLDSVEQIRGTSVNAREVASSLETLFMGHSNVLKIPDLHAVYTVPPWLKIKAPGVAGLYSGCQLIPCVKVRDRHGPPCTAGLDELEQIVAKRGDWRRLLGDDRSALDELLVASGGYLRDLFRILQTVLRLTRLDALPASPRVRKLALDEVRNSYLPLSNEDALWLRRIDGTGNTELDGESKLHDLARFYDTHLVLTYRNGDEWVAVHPLIETAVREQAARIVAVAAAAKSPDPNR